MKTLKLRLVFLLLMMVWSMFSGVFVGDVRAADSCKDSGINFTNGNPPTTVYVGDTITISLSGLTSGVSYSLWATNFTNDTLLAGPVVASNSQTATFTFTLDENSGKLPPLGTDNIHIDLKDSGNNAGFHCALWHDTEVIDKGAIKCGKIRISQTRGGEACFWNDNNSCMETGMVTAHLSGFMQGGKPMEGEVEISTVGALDGNGGKVPISNGIASKDLSIPNTGNIDIIVYTGPSNEICRRSVNFIDSCGDNCAPVEDDPIELEAAREDPYFLCTQLPDGSDAQEACISCATGGGGVENPGDDESRQGVWTAFGCIKRDPQNIIATLIEIGMMSGGGIALLMILGAGFIISTSQGDPKKVSDAKELITAAVTGLLFIIFSVMMLQFIGFSVFKIPGFGG